MFDYHGWTRVQGSIDGFGGAADGLSQEAFDAVREAVADVGATEWQTADLRIANASAHLWLAGIRNHGQDPVIDAYRRVAEIAPWSYGTLYVFDDEAEGDDDNIWTVWVMKRGGVTAHRDAFLSPACRRGDR